MKRYPVAAFCALLLFAVCWLACKKKNNTPAPAKYTGCRIAKVRQTEYDTSSWINYTFSYNNDGTISYVSVATWLNDNYRIFFTYKLNYVLAVTIFQGDASPGNKDSLVMDAGNRVVYIDHYNYNGLPPRNQVWDKFLYDAAGQLYACIHHNYSTESVDSFQWQNGDIARYAMNANTGLAYASIYNYLYTDTAYNTGIINGRLSDILAYGRPVYTNKHLNRYAIRYALPVSDTIVNNYTVDNTGKLTYLYDPTALMPYSYITYECE